MLTACGQVGGSLSADVGLLSMRTSQTKKNTIESYKNLIFRQKSARGTSRAAHWGARPPGAPTGSDGVSFGLRQKLQEFLSGSDRNSRSFRRSPTETLGVSVGLRQKLEEFPSDSDRNSRSFCRAPTETPGVSVGARQNCSVFELLLKCFGHALKRCLFVLLCC